MTKQFYVVAALEYTVNDDGSGGEAIIEADKAMIIQRLYKEDSCKCIRVYQANEMVTSLNVAGMLFP